MRTAFGLIALLSCGIVLVLGGCPTTTPAGTDGETGDKSTDERVSAFMPAAISLDIDELPEDDDSTSAQLAPVRNNYQRATRSASTIVHRFQKLADNAMQLGNRIAEDMTSAAQTQVEGTFYVGGQEVGYKADFSAFDFDGDGAAEGSGNAVDTPVAVRLWVDQGSGYERFMCALIARKPTTDNFGIGEVYIVPDAAVANAPEDVQIYISYDRSTAAHRWNIAYVSGTLHPEYQLDTGVARVDVRANDEQETEKTVRATYAFTDNPYGFEIFQCAVHYLRGGTGLLISAVSSGGMLQVGFENTCVDLETQSVANGGPCADYDTQDMTLLEQPTGDEAAFPTAFNETPTF